MLEIGKLNHLNVVKWVEFGIYLDGGELGEILMPMRYVPENLNPGDALEVFIYNDSEDRILATTETPLAMVGDFACLKVVEVNNTGAFLDWGLPKDLLVPYSEQKVKMETGKSYVVAIYLDEKTSRIVASAKLDKFIDNEPQGLASGQQVDLLIYNQTDLGYKAIINNRFTGILYKNEVFSQLRIGQRTKGYIKHIREDEKIDLSLNIQGYSKTDDITVKIINKLKDNDGHLNVNDKTPAETIYNLFGESKKSFKIALGALYKNRIITIDKDGINLLKID